MRQPNHQGVLQKPWTAVRLTNMSLPKGTVRKDAQRACEKLGAWALEVFVLCLTVLNEVPSQKTPSQKEPLFFPVCDTEKFSKGDRIGWMEKRVSFNTEFLFIKYSEKTEGIGNS